MNNSKIGQIGEDLAVKFLQSKKYTIIQRNYHTRQGEVDIVAKDHGQMVFIEVKTRTSSAFGTPEESFTWHKRQRFRSACSSYLTVHPKIFGWHAELISIELNLEYNSAKIRHYQFIEL